MTMQKNAPKASAQSPSGGDDARWLAVLERDQGARGRFVYAVRSTGVVCDPGCRSRTPKRENVVFYRELKGALRDGFRACQRCRPGQSAADHWPSCIVPACRALQGQPAPTLTQLSAELGVSTRRLRRAFVDNLGITPREFVEAVRAGRFRAALGDSDSVLDASYAAGFGAPSRMYAKADDLLGMPPADYRRKATGQEITIATAACALGAVAVAATRSGVCAVELGDDESTVASALQTRFAGAQVTTASAAAVSWVANVVQLIDGHAVPEAIPLDIRGTAFQQKVWQALREIPSGCTVSYAQLAAAIGQPTAARAVARACATNSLAVVVPCHRVVRGDGSLSGYRWGVERKRALLDVERDD
ncbi:MAG: bifunctional DNA-binding transcriptional regulator/O6-methylguanine-DNA methyltransferase Ada [Gammaproteobacteria bacterium]